MITRENLLLAIDEDPNNENLYVELCTVNISYIRSRYYAYFKCNYDIVERFAEEKLDMAPRNKKLLAKVWDNNPYKKTTCTSELEGETPVYIDEQDNITNLIEYNMNGDHCNEIIDFEKAKVFQRLNKDNLDHYSVEQICQHIKKYQREIGICKYVYHDDWKEIHVSVPAGTIPDFYDDLFYVNVRNDQFCRGIIISILEEIYRYHDIELTKDYVKLRSTAYHFDN